MSIQFLVVIILLDFEKKNFYIAITNHFYVNYTQYKTQGPKELQAILQQRKQKADTHNDDVGRPPSFAPESPDYSDDNSEGKVLCFLSFR